MLTANTAGQQGACPSCEQVVTIQPDVLDLKSLATLLPSDAAQPVAPVAESQILHPQMVEPQIQVAVARPQSQQATAGKKKRTLIYVAAGAGGVLILLVVMLLLVGGGSQSTPEALGGGELGYYTNTETGDLYVRARTYEPKQGRWLSVDPLGFVDASNPYMYARDNPVNYFDPSGLREYSMKQPRSAGSNCDPNIPLSFLELPGMTFVSFAGVPKAIAREIEECRLPVIREPKLRIYCLMLIWLRVKAPNWPPKIKIPERLTCQPINGSKYALTKWIKGPPSGFCFTSCTRCNTNALNCQDCCDMCYDEYKKAKGSAANVPISVARNLCNLACIVSPFHKANEPINPMKAALLKEIDRYSQDTLRRLEPYLVKEIEDKVR